LAGPPKENESPEGLSRASWMLVLYKILESPNKRAPLGYEPFMNSERSLAPADAESLVELIFHFPEISCFICPVRVRARLVNLLTQGSPLVVWSNDAAIWLGHTGNVLLYAAATIEALGRLLPKALEHLGPQGQAIGARECQVWPSSAGARDVFAAHGFQTTFTAARMEMERPRPSQADPRLRATTPDDLGLLAQVGFATFPEYGWTIEGWQVPFAHHPPGWLAFVDDVPAGFLTIELTVQNAFITGLAVAPEMRRRGLGRALVARAMNFGATEGRAMAVYANDSADAMGCYLQAGFVRRYPMWDMEMKW
jgi:GNAT superfamily N-acetyltransferase